MSRKNLTKIMDIAYYEFNGFFNGISEYCNFALKRTLAWGSYACNYYEKPYPGGSSIVLKKPSNI